MKAKPKEYITFNTQYVYLNEEDAKKRRNPLFSFDCKISDIDFSRIESIDGIDVQYSLTKSIK